ncbi:MAG: VOC family protein [Actinomycetota bacterium]|nr:VOC family protein [Actinomycetota bacterium]
MTLEIQCLTIDCKDPDRLAGFWASVLGYETTYQSAPEEQGEREVAISEPGGGWELLFLEAPDEKVVKNRLHLDLRPEDRDAEVDRLVALGARKIDIGQGPEVTWVVLADPEGNEFCVLRALTPEERAGQG